jgi:AraC-like DNA-binding protein
MSKQRLAMLRLADQLGVPWEESNAELQHLRINDLQVIDLLPEMMIMVRSVVANETFSFRRKPVNIIEKGLFISFQNMLNITKDELHPGRPLIHQPHVRITPSHLESEVIFPKEVNTQQVTILLELSYLKRFIGQDQGRLDYLFNVEQTFWIEEFMSPEMATLVNEISNNSADIILPQAYYRLRSLELIYLLFKNLLNRQDVKHHHLSNYEIDAIYLVRNAIESSLDRSISTEEMIKLSGMNELKLRKLFSQIFGMGLNAYHQYKRMHEAARLLQEEHLSVSEVGYQLGFSNLSYFGRLFEAHFGLKPKKWRDKHKMK